uniref:Dehydrogenase/reductase (SDR family) member 11a n=1 Tax=Cyprinus carpio TaxID=7962 RepID=A0A8C2Q9A3_CYPCA
MFSAIKTLHQGVDVCINNAGLAHNEPLLSGRTEGWRNMIDVSAALYCVFEAFNSCCCSSLGSMGGHRMVPSADEHFYCATKYAVTAMTEGLRQELREAKTHIRATVSLLEIGQVITENMNYIYIYIYINNKY